MLNHNKKDILDNNYYLNKRKDAKDKTTFTRFKNRSFIIGIVFGIVATIFLYLLSDYSNVYHITIDGNRYLTDEDVLKLSGLSDKSKFILTSPLFVKNKIMESPYMEDVQVSKLNDKVINIKVIEKKEIGYIYEDGTSNILLIDGERIELNKDNYYLIKNIPLIEGYSKEQMSDVLRGFKNIDADIINEISEIHRYPFTYDENMMEIVMRDGNYCFVSWTGLEMLKEYYRIVSGIDSSIGKACIYLDELTKSGYASACPWQEIMKQESEST